MKRQNKTKPNKDEQSLAGRNEFVVVFTNQADIITFYGFGNGF